MDPKLLNSLVSYVVSDIQCHLMKISFYLLLLKVMVNESCLTKQGFIRVFVKLKKMNTLLSGLKVSNCPLSTLWVFVCWFCFFVLTTKSVGKKTAIFTP